VNDQQAAESALSLRGQPSADWHDLGLRIELGYRLRWSGGGVFCAGVSRRRTTKSGNEGKPEHVLSLCADTPHETLRQLADLLDPAGPAIEAP
jgi:hypothetical protein